MNFWQTFWTLVFFAALGIFAILAVVVSIGGFRDVKEMLKTLDREHHQS